MTGLLFPSIIFKKKSWSSLGKKSIVKDYYPYARLHLLALLGLNGIIEIQYVTGALNSPIIFDFLFQTLEKDAHHIGKDLVGVLDNSPLNHSNAVRNLAWKNEFTLLFTAPNSCFLNPIELLFAKFKASLKTKITASK